MPFTTFWYNVALVGKEKEGTTIVLLNPILVRFHTTRIYVGPFGTECLGITTLRIPFAGSK